MFLNRNDIEKIQEVLSKFPDLDVFELKQDSSSGVGSILSITFAREVNNIRGSFEIEISGVENW